MNASLGDTAFAALRAVLGTQPLCSLGDTAFGISGTQLFNERAHFHMYSSPQSRCKSQRHAIRRCDAAEFECSFTRR
ncbi:MAG: hypothetical protein RLZZ536_1179 [Planctomycetota bacterium]|jgi:hypothetical protein